MASLLRKTSTGDSDTELDRDPAIPAIAVVTGLVGFLMVAASVNSLGLATIVALAMFGAVGLVAAGLE